MYPVRYGVGFYIPEGFILHIHRRENLLLDIMSRMAQLRVTASEETLNSTKSKLQWFWTLSIVCVIVRVLYILLRNQVYILPDWTKSTLVRHLNATSDDCHYRTHGFTHFTYVLLQIHKDRRHRWNARMLYRGLPKQ
jgi:hypothetical protein